MLFADSLHTSICVPVPPISLALLHNLKVSSLSCQAAAGHVNVAPEAAVKAPPLRHFEMTPSDRNFAGGFIPKTNFTSAPLKHIQMSLETSCLADFCIPKTTMTPALLQYIEMPTESRPFAGAFHPEDSLP